ncbi:MAG: radical SAM protein [Deltaproteobacteria bacterium]|nr:radical SAM protein [Deltaproteobacteria bacterium]
MKQIASLFLLPDCNASCVFCAADRAFSTMSLPQAEGLLDDLSRGPIRNVVLGGGEPFLWPHGVLLLAASAKARGFLVQVCTNGLALPAGFAEERAVDRFILPIESIDPEIHDRLRGCGPGHHARMLTHLERLTAARRSFTLSTVVTALNVDRLGDLARMIEALTLAGAPLHAWHLYRFLPVGRAGARNRARLAIAPERFLAAWLAARAHAPHTRIYRRDDMLASSSVEFFWADGGAIRTGSEAWNRSVADAG